MKSYPLYIGGRDVEGSGWTYVLDASAFLRDPDASFDLKRALELGTVCEPTEEVIARCAWGGDKENALALESARAAAAQFGSMPVETRKAIMLDFHSEVTARADELIDIMVAEGHPRRLARWELSGVLRNCEPAIADWYQRQFETRFEWEGRQLALVRRPDGVVCINPPQNAGTSSTAFAVMALFAGNAVVVKAPRSCPFGIMFLCREVIAPILESHGAPPGTLNVATRPASSAAGLPARTSTTSSSSATARWDSASAPSAWPSARSRSSSWPGTTASSYGGTPTSTRRRARCPSASSARASSAWSPSTPSFTPRSRRASSTGSSSWSRRSGPGTRTTPTSC
jgi:acyl-CoA reductase-like NAD-dependent aldehyde dehydrogenase